MRRKKETDERPIGIFDSGLGGLTVMQAISILLPGESMVYFSDGAFCPYGNRAPSEIIDRSFKITKFLISKGAKAIVVACNTATAAAIDDLRNAFPLPFIGIEPAIKQAALHTSSGKVGVLATRNTFKGRLYQETSAKYANDKNVLIAAGDGLVELVEEGRMDTPEAKELLAGYLLPMIEAGVDQIVLGCTHYPFLIPAIRSLVPDHVEIHDPSPAVARQTRRVLLRHGLLSNKTTGEYLFFTSRNSDNLSNLAQKIDIRFNESQEIEL